MSAVRYATLEDGDILVEMGRAEHAASRWSRLPFSEAAMRKSAAEFITTTGRTLLVTEGGYLAGLVQPLGFVDARTVALEYAWYSHDGSGIALLLAFERWAENMGAAAVVVNDHSETGRLHDVLASRRGYRAIGTTICKFLER